MSLPIIGITMGDPAGIGPEVIVKSLVDENLYGNFSSPLYQTPSVAFEKVR